tara:strand:+ start:148 stop:354 length:207 start_codon:yes stop_codon:yes gene_type:complete
MAYKCSDCNATDKLLYYMADDGRQFFVPDNSVEGYVDENQLMKCRQCSPRKGIFIGVKAHNNTITETH